MPLHETSTEVRITLVLPPSKGKEKGAMTHTSISARLRRRGYVTALVLAAPAVTGTAIAKTGVSVEGVSDYTLVCGNTGCNTDCTTEAKGFLNGLSGHGGFTTKIAWFDGNVFDSDFLDPDISGGDSRDTDAFGFDAPGTAVALVCAHGTCDDITNNACTNSSQCGGGYCPGSPPAGAQSACIQNTARRIDTSSNGDIHNHAAFYTNGGNARWGENATVGAWAGAATNGDDNAAFLINSCAVRPAFILNQMRSAFAGVALVNLMMPTSNLANGKFADAATWSSRGGTLATNAVANLNGAMMTSWDALLDSTPQGQGSACPNLDGNFKYGGGHGFSGCGAQVSMSMDSNNAFAQQDQQETWNESQNEAWASFGNAYWYWHYHCNHDCNTYPLQK
jgi:hypothetical protein